MKTISFNTQHLCIEHEGERFRLDGETVHTAGMTTEEHRKKLRVLIPFSIGIVIAIFGGIFVLDKALVCVMSMMLTAMGVTETGMVYNILLCISVCINAVVILLVAVGKKRVAPFMQKHSNKLIIALIINVVLTGAWVLAK